MKRKKPLFIRDWFDEFTRWEKWWNRKMERLNWKRQIEKEKQETEDLKDARVKSNVIV